MQISKYYDYSFRLSGKHGHRHADMENADTENADLENADMENADKHIKNSCIVNGLPCNRFGLPEKFHVSFKY